MTMMHPRELKYPSLKEPKRLHAFFNFQEWAALLAAIGELHPEILDRVQVARDAGLRPAEHAYLTWADIDLHRRVIRITGKPGLWEPKTWEERVIPMTDTVLRILKRRGKERKGPWVFSDGPAPVVSISRSLSACAAHAGIEKKVGPNMLRHTFATHGLLQGITSRSVGEIMGHKDERTTGRYVHAIKEELAREITLMDRKRAPRKSGALPTNPPHKKQKAS
ncbi:MAG TPA: site-specific integrase [Dissulfurispiraceae bacterium]|nr:site-specific integrase [Dissulfurispiraceae bacterium]